MLKKENDFDDPESPGMSVVAQTAGIDDQNIDTEANLAYESSDEGP